MLHSNKLRGTVLLQQFAVTRLGATKNPLLRIAWLALCHFGLIPDIRKSVVGTAVVMSCADFPVLISAS